MAKGLPTENNVNILKNIVIKAEFEQKFFKLESKFYELLVQTLTKREQILTGKFEAPKELSVSKPQPMNGLDSDDKESLESNKLEIKNCIDKQADSKEIPNYWLKVQPKAQHLYYSDEIADDKEAKKDEIGASDMSGAESDKQFVSADEENGTTDTGKGSTQGDANSTVEG